MLSTIAEVSGLLWVSAGTLFYRTLMAAVLLLFLVFVGSWLPAWIRPFRRL